MKFSILPLRKQLGTCMHIKIYILFYSPKNILVTAVGTFGGFLITFIQRKKKWPFSFRDELRHGCWVLSKWAQHDISHSRPTRTSLSPALLALSRMSREARGCICHALAWAFGCSIENENCCDQYKEWPHLLFIVLGVWSICGIYTHIETFCQTEPCITTMLMQLHGPTKGNKLFSSVTLGVGHTMKKWVPAQ